MILKNKKIKTIIISFVIIIVSLLLTNTILAYTMNIKIIPLIGAKIKSKFAYNIVPADYKNFIYIKDFQNIRIFIEKSEFLKKFKDNYLIEDLKSRYYQNFDLFFIKMEFNLIELSKNIKDDFLVGTYDKDQFLITSIDFNTKVIFSIINMLPTDINEESYGKNKYYYITKNGADIYYTIINDYVVFSNSSEIIKKSIDSIEKSAVQENLYNICLSDEIYFRNNISSDYNKYDLLPYIDDLSLKMNVKTGKADINCTSSDNAKIAGVFKKENFEALKLLPIDMSLCYFSNNYDLNGILNNVYQSSNSANVKNPVDLSVLNNFSDSILIGYNNLNFGKKDTDLSPEICFVFNLKQAVTPKDLDLISDKMKNVVNAIIGTKNWIVTNNTTKNYKMFREKLSEFSMIVYNRYIIVAYGNTFADGIIGQISNSAPSLYDRFYKSINAANDNLVYYTFINTSALAESIEPSLQSFLNTNLSIDNEEYNNSFGQVFELIKEKKPLSIKLYYDKNKNIYYGNSEFIAQ